MPAPRIDLPLTPDRLEAVERGLKRFLPQVMEGARDLIKENAVVEARWATPDILHAVVVSGDTYELDVRFNERGILGSECGCPYYIWCKHAAAALLSVKNSESGKSGTPRKVSGEVRPSEGSLAEAVVKKLDLKGLPTAAAQALSVIEEWGETKKRVVPQYELSNLAAPGSRVTYVRQDTPLYPQSFTPTSELELLYCVESAMQKLGMSLPNPLPLAVDRVWQARLNESWEHDKLVKQWREKLNLWVTEEERAEEVTPRFRLRLAGPGALVEWQPQGSGEFAPVKSASLREWIGKMQFTENFGKLDPGSRLVLSASAVQSYGGPGSDHLSVAHHHVVETIGRLLGMPDLSEAVVGEDGAPLVREAGSMRWVLSPPPDTQGIYELRPLDGSGQTPEPPLLVTKVRRDLHYYVTPKRVIEVTNWPFGNSESWPVRLPSEVLETSQGVVLLQKLGLPLPEKLEQRVHIVKPEVLVRCRLYRPGHGRSEYFQLQGVVDSRGAANNLSWAGNQWGNARNLMSARPKNIPAGAIMRSDRKGIVEAASWIQQWVLKKDEANSYGKNEAWWEQRITSKDFPDQFIAWLEIRPPGVEVELDSELLSLKDGQVSGTVRLEVEETSMDWFDLRVEMSISDLTLTKEEIDMLLKAQGRWVRLEGKGWRKLSLDLTPEQEAELAEMGLAAGDFDGQTQRLHALQLAGGKTKSLLPPSHVERVTRRAQEIQTRVAPDLPASITASLRPYQLSGFHFLAYLTTNHFGGILADDMGLGKTLQSLSWIAWLRETSAITEPALVVCPKSVQENWLGEATKFFPGLRAKSWNRAAAGSEGLDGDCDLLVIHYQQLRLHEEILNKRTWGAVILDEAQAIKNPSSQTHQVACGLRADYRLALSGTPIENRLLDLWAIMNFAMPGALGSRANFAKNFDSKTDPNARKRLSARTRPFLLRRTKKEVASDLPDRIEEDLLCEMEGPQAKLYQAELKRARAQLLKLQTAKELDKARFNVLTSLLRLRQICCHPRLVGHNEESTESAKLEALMELLEPIMEEGGKVLVFSQFVQMLAIVQEEIEKREWPHFILTGQTDDRGDLVKAFQEKEGNAVFLISLKAGGFGLNLTAASYVVLCDPWWNPAVEAQAIDRTHRIGQTQTVIAYRLLVKESIEEKIRMLQKQKGALAQDILGEENFASALTLDDFNFLLGAG